jgi:hypothetical protein
MSWFAIGGMILAGWCVAAMLAGERSRGMNDIEAAARRRAKQQAAPSDTEIIEVG